MDEVPLSPHLQSIQLHAESDVLNRLAQLLFLFSGVATVEAVELQSAESCARWASNEQVRALFNDLLPRRLPGFRQLLGNDLQLRHLPIG